MLKEYFDSVFPTLEEMMDEYEYNDQPTEWPTPEFHMSVATGGQDHSWMVEYKEEEE